MDKFLRHNPVLLWLERKGFYRGSTFPLVPLVAKHIGERVNYYNQKKDFETKGREDFLDKFLKAKETHPKAMTEREVLSLSLTMVLAGSETTLDLLPILLYPVPNPIHWYCESLLIQLILKVPLH